MRCLTLARELERLDAKIIFLCTDETVATMPILASSGYSIQSETHSRAVDWLVIDHYGIDISYESAARGWAKNILLIDDLANRLHDCDVLIDMTYGRAASDYAPFVPAGCKILTGADYALLRPEFPDRAMPKNFSDAGNVLVSFGGVNPKRVTQKTLNMLRRYNDRILDIDIVTGAGAAGLEDIRSLEQSLKEDRFHKVHLHVDTTRMADLMTKAHLCLGAGGTTSWERCCMGLPTLAIELADNQAKILKELDRAEALKDLGQIETLNDKVFLDAFAALIADQAGLKLMSEKAKAICDGKGAARVADIICA